MTSINPRLNRTYCGLDERYPVVIQIIRQRQKREIDTPFRLRKEEFNNQTGQAVYINNQGHSPGAITEINRHLALIRMEIETTADALHQEKGESYTASDIAEVYRRRRGLALFFAFAEELIDNLTESNREGTANNYRNACNALALFLGNRFLLFNDFTAKLVDDFAAHQKRKGNQDNTVVFYLKQLRAIYNKALAKRLIQADLTPFRNQTLKETKTRKRALPLEEIRQVEQVDLTGFHKDVELARDLFMASFYLCGIAFVDMCYLKKENIDGQYICYQRRKTGQQLRIRMEQPLKELLSRLAVPGSPYLFPMLRTGADERKNYRNEQNRLGRRVRELGLLLQFKFPLTLYVARHTWATLAHNGGVDTPVISSCLGHTSEKTTRIYLADMDSEKVDSANLFVINSLL